MQVKQDNYELIDCKYRDRKNAHIRDMRTYQNMYNLSIKDPEKFWADKAQRLHWYKKWDYISDSNLIKGQIKWFLGGKINISYNCLDRHIEKGLGGHKAIIWESNDPAYDKSFSYKELLCQVSKFSNVLKTQGVKKGDRVCIYLQMIPELAIAMLACARIGAVHSIVFGAFSSNSLSSLR